MTKPMTENKRARQVKKTDCLVIGWYDGATPKVILNGTDEDLKNGAKLYCEYSEVERLEYEREAARALGHESIVNLESKLRVLEEKLQYHDKIVDHKIDLHMKINALESENAELKSKMAEAQSEIERLRAVRERFKVHGSDGCQYCDSGRITLYTTESGCLECKPNEYKSKFVLENYKRLSEQLADYQQVVDFYGDENSWYLLEKTASIITDVDLRKNKDSGGRITGGKLARTMQSKWGIK